MCGDNETMVTEIFLVGFQNIQKIKSLLFSLFFIIYLVILAGNLLIMLLVFISNHLKHPMYLFLAHLALADLLLTTSIIPNMLYIILMEGRTISLNGCIVQWVILTFAAFTQSCLLSVMSFDRYLAICIPLRYSSIMTMKLSFQLVISSWSVGFVLVKTEVIMICQLQFCTFNVIDHFFCDFAPLLALTSSSIFMLIWVDFSFNIFIILMPFILISVSYICIFIAILKISSANGKKKAFSTCTSHLTIVCAYYGTLITIYMSSSGEDSFEENKFKSLLFVVLTPVINPILYSLRNKDIKEALNIIFKCT